VAAKKRKFKQASEKAISANFEEVSYLSLFLLNKGTSNVFVEVNAVRPEKGMTSKVELSATLKKRKLWYHHML
jgi:hypothetical protein